MSFILTGSGVVEIDIQLLIQSAYNQLLMENTMRKIILGVISTFIFASIAVTADKGLVSVKSSHSVKETVDRLEKIIQKILETHLCLVSVLMYMVL